MVKQKRSGQRNTEKFPVKVFVSLTHAQAYRLDDVAMIDPPVAGRPAALRRLIDTLDDEDLTTPDAAEGKEVLSPEDVSAVLDALYQRTRAYGELSKQVRAAGHLLNTLTRLGHQIATYGRDAAIPVAAVEGVARRVEVILDRVSVMAHQDQYVETVVRSCQPR